MQTAKLSVTNCHAQTGVWRGQGVFDGQATAGDQEWAGRWTPEPDQQDRSPTGRGIRVLPAEVSARIAAGEVIDRPASAVKELVENALDAGARAIRIDVHGGGLSQIRVGDDGCGIPPGELWLACQRHATSKLAGDDLAQVRTLGFRGEALPSIAAVADLMIVSADDERGLGRRLTLRDGRAIADEPVARGRGTTVTARNLFHNVPARLAAAARPQAELTQIAQTARRLALAAPSVRFALWTDERLVFQTTGSGELATALAEVYGVALAPGLIALGPARFGETVIRGVVAGPEVTRPGRGQVNLIVNGRWVQPRVLLAQIEAAYRPVLPRGRHPVLALVIETAPDQVDINVHPAKLDVRLLREREIGAMAGEVVRAALGRRAVPLGLAPAMGVDALPGRSVVAEEQAAYDGDAPILTPYLPPLRLIGQVQNRLILLESDAGLYLVDQHRAHERVLYERLAAMNSDAVPEPVALPEPLLLELRPAQIAQFGRRLDDLAALGFACEVFGGRTFLLRTAPILPGALGVLTDPADLTAGVIALAEDGEPGEGEDWRQRLLVRLSCRTAVRRGRPLAGPDMRGLVRALGETPSPAVCPHGSPLLMHVSGDLLSRQFDWE
jgi:DNA mismatch repair protein MutL